VFSVCLSVCLFIALPTGVINVFINTRCMYSRVVTGVPLGEQPRKKTSIPGDLNLEQLEDFLVQLYPRVPQLVRVGFFLAKATKMRQLVILNCNVLTTSDVK